MERDDHFRLCLVSWCRASWNKPRLYSLRMINWHFWLATLGIGFLRLVDVGRRGSRRV